MSDSDAELIARAIKGDLAAFQRLYERHWNAVYRFAWLLTNAVPDAEDITQECFLTLIRKRGDFDPSRAQLRTWLIAIARNQHLMRRRKVGYAASTAELESSGVPAGLEEELIRLERAEAVRRAVQAFQNRSEFDRPSIWRRAALPVAAVAASLLMLAIFFALRFQSSPVVQTPHRARYKLVSQPRSS